VVDTAVGIAEPEVQSPDECRSCRGGLALQQLGSGLDTLLEGEHVEGSGVDLDEVAIAASKDRIGTESAAEVVDIALNRGPGRLWRFPGPNGIDQGVLGNDPVGRTKQYREHHLLVETTQFRDMTVELDRDRAERPVSHGVNLNSPQRPSVR